MNSAYTYWLRQCNLLMNELAEHGDSFDKEGRAITEKLKLAVAAKNLHANNLNKTNKL